MPKSIYCHLYVLKNGWMSYLICGDHLWLKLREIDLAIVELVILFCASQTIPRNEKAFKFECKDFPSGFYDRVVDTLRVVALLLEILPLFGQ